VPKTKSLLKDVQKSNLKIMPQTTKAVSKASNQPLNQVSMPYVRNMLPSASFKKESHPNSLKKSMMKTITPEKRTEDD